MKPIRLNEAPPVAKRPKCPQCDKPLTPLFLRVKSERIPIQGGGHTYQDTLKWDGDYRSYGVFCTLRCAERFANAAHKAGYRRR